MALCFGCFEGWQETTLSLCFACFESSGRTRRYPFASLASKGLAEQKYMRSDQLTHGANDASDSMTSMIWGLSD